ncbi:hypothetical protein AB0K60_37080 [Thermopolyspora sp. NPDC052614]|uniref:hypothetical protein n=1 Tax=Thermopolyspora sp. NPDC052614 TaxID=3155682 RepID=UPI00344510F4
MRIWIAHRDYSQVEISDEYAAQRFIEWLARGGLADLDAGLARFVHAPWDCGGLGAGMLDAPEDLDRLRRAVLARWTPVKAI